MRIILAGLALLVVIGGAALAWATRHPEIAALQAPPAAASAELIETGEVLAAVGDCAVCHTAPGGQPYAGGLAVETPFGTIHSTNITPDPATGIGAWSLDAFRRALHQGVSRNGQYLYPAFPYDHYTKVSDADVEALYAFLTSLDPVESAPKPNELRFPFNQRVLMAGWNLLFFKEGRYQPDPSRSEEWNRGAYLAEGLGHCGACHTPRNALGALEGDRHYDGATVEGWHAPALNEQSPSQVPWTADSLVNYFLDGWDQDHGIAAGPMTPVVNEMALLSEEDAYAVAEYVLSLQNQEDIEGRTTAAQTFAEARQFGSPETPATGPAPTGDPAYDAGLAIFSRVCANCHRAGTETAPLGALASINGPDPSNLLHVVVDGIVPPANSPTRTMPAFGGALSEAELVNLATFMRTHFSQQPAWTNIAERAREIQNRRDPVAGTEATGEAN
ncbi:MAG: cytochrome c, class [Devosia sp.]|nr:cytochrome c, class [Devosia sp.]